MKSRATSVLSSLLLCAAAAAAGPAPPSLAPSTPPPLDPREVHLADLVQLTFAGENAEAYWAPDGRELVLQSTRPPYACDQIFRLPADGKGDAALVSTGKGRTTCSYFTNNGERILFSSTHQAGDACPPPPDRSQGYVWSIDPDYEIWSAQRDGSDLKRVTENRAYDAESTVCPVDGSVIFTSTRDGDLDLYRMDADGSHVRRLTHTPGYDGGAFFSADCSQIVWRASRPAAGKELDEYRALLAQGLVRPNRLEIFVARADGSAARQVTHLDAASFAPYFFPSGKRIIFSSNHGDPQGREFDLWAVDTDGTNLERVTWTPGFEGFPMFSPDGKRLAFSSNRRQSAPGETDVFVARWVDQPDRPDAAAGRFRADVAWLADDAREGRGVGTAGLDAARDWLAARFREIGLAPAGDGGSWLHAFEVPVAIEVGEGTAVTIDGAALARADFQPAAFSGSTAAPLTAPVVAAGYGVTAPELEVDDYKGIDARGKIVAVRRFVPAGAPFDKEEAERRYSDVRFKAWTAREHGAVGMIVVDQPAPANPAAEPPADSPLPEPRVDTSLAAAAGDAGLPVVYLTRGSGGALFSPGAPGGHRATLAVALTHRTSPAANVVGIVRAGAPDRLPGAVLVGAHYDHIGRGGAASLAPGSSEIHNGADDNASGTAALLEVARRLAAERGKLRRDVWIVAFSGEEEGALGSTAFARKPPAGLALGDLEAMLNMDMVGRLRDNALSVLGSESAAEWNALVPPLCQSAGLACSLGGDGFGASDQSSFYAAGVPVLHFFTGVHEDYHKPSDDADKINAEGGAEVAGLVADVAAALAGRPERLSYKVGPAAPPQGDLRASGASLGTVPDYAGDGRPGVLLAGVRSGSPAEKGGLQRGDLLVELAGTPIREIHDLMFVLRRAKPGEKATAVVERAGARLSLPITFEASRGVR
jgi:Tol biopolymer transport system component